METNVFMFIFALGLLQQLAVYMFTLDMAVNMLILVCRFQPQDMEVQLSDELAGSLRRLKVLHCYNDRLLIHFDLCQ